MNEEKTQLTGKSEGGGGLLLLRHIPVLIHFIPREELSQTQPQSLEFVEYTELNPPQKIPVCCQLTNNLILFNPPKTSLQ